MTSVYIARDEYDADDDEQQFDSAGTSHTNGATANEDGGDDAEYDEQDYEQGHAEEEYYEEEYYEEKEADVIPEPPARPVKPVSDVDDSVYYDHTSLMRCWTSALSDYKFLHPSSFLASTEAPRSKRAKHLAAPLWYGPLPLVGTSSTTGRSRSVFSTSTTTTTNMNGGPPSYHNMSASQKRNAKKRARRDRLAAQHATQEKGISPFIGGEALGGGGKRRRLGSRDGSHDEPSWTPQSPDFQRDASVEAKESEKDEEVEVAEQATELQMDVEPTGPSTRPSSTLTRDSTRTKTLPTAAGPSLPSSSSRSNAASSFLPNLTEPSPFTSSLLPKKQTHPSRTPTTFLSPPPIVPLDPETITSVRAERLEAARQRKVQQLRKAQCEEEAEVEGEDESEQGLLQSALWAWYTAGYQTALYHAAVGVAGVTE
ncbi:hypothetical protein MVLG_05993 [Microbotryum lychnidis-dioicae p1A1 Lamole]|uniref:Uncharacterized protein n=1 Tax=Microbotryum lychnidis-dioicae (strain p1A1 Lamole / MvSl-1064) TaxID=683840 RepID=U5HFW9_USTV1|nr:hypothetical protein MVLG_05993 [Microbotryum lychnidis-dioicae p1A1 Lamole]|eukprot:KDE03526.1 hypothetical protein MVLG_05993 [Microbotryum lychnidis-dioicae p1A1 Lamole]